MKEDAIKEGLEQGKEENKIEMIKSMLKNDINIEKISNISGKSMEEIKEIAKNVNINF